MGRPIRVKEAKTLFRPVRLPYSTTRAIAAERHRHQLAEDGFVAPNLFLNGSARCGEILEVSYPEVVSEDLE